MWGFQFQCELKVTLVANGMNEYNIITKPANEGWIKLTYSMYIKNVNT